eukprot:m51a1_g3072 hypothetical protein (463) ;mRNA; f:28346-30016
MGATVEARVALAALTATNLYNYFTRYIPSATKDLIKADLGLSDFQTGVMFTAFITCYMIVGPVVGFIADMRLVPRKASPQVLVVAGVLTWSVATCATGLCTSFGMILVPRVLFGVGEATFGSLAPALICDYFPPASRTVALSLFMSATPIGCALGYTVGAELGQALGWREAFLILGLPGAASLLFLFVREPEPGALDDGPLATREVPSLLRGFRMLLTNANFVFAVAGYVAVTFGMGGFSDWLPTLFVRYRAMSVAYAGALNGAVVVSAGLTGTLAGCFAGERLARAGVRQPMLLLASCTMLASTACAATSLALMTRSSTPVIECMFVVTVFFGWWYNGPINTLINNSVPANLRSRANGLTMLSIHLLGDSFSPAIIGAVSDATGGDLLGALAMVPATLAVATELWFIGWWLAPDATTAARAGDKAAASAGAVDEERLRLVPPDDASEGAASYGSLDSIPVV